jgi:hypothetical protein
VPPSLVGKDFDSKGVFSVPSLGRVSINYEANPIWDDIGSLRGGLLTNYMPAYMTYQTFQWQHFFQRQQASSKMKPSLKRVGHTHSRSCLCHTVPVRPALPVKQGMSSMPERQMIVCVVGVRSTNDADVLFLPSQPHAHRRDRKNGLAKARGQCFLPLASCSLHRDRDG